jgi:hypothetical protein
MNILHVPLFVKADSPEKLVSAMIQTNSDNRVSYKYFSIVYDGSNWFGWYYGDATLLIKQAATLPKNETVRPQIGRTKKIP